MSKSKAFENDLLKLIFNGTPISGLADNAGAGPLTNLYMALHTADPGETGNQSTSEVNYGGYQRIAVLRSPAGWTVNASAVSPTEAIEFNEMLSGTPGTATYATVGTAATGAGKVLYRGALTPAIAYNVGSVPRLRTTSTITED